MDFLNRDDILNGKFPEKNKTFHEILYYYASKGLTDDSLAMACGMPLSEFREMRRSDKEVEKTIFKARMPMIDAIDKVAWELAMGKKQKRKITTKTYQNGDTEITETISDSDPDKGMLLLMMKNFANYSNETVISVSDEEKQKTEQMKTLLK